jgi:tRNA1Val (adenine37-N6)-methyltransferase
MANSYFQFKQFTIHQDRCAMKVTTDACLFGAWVGGQIENRKSESDSYRIGSGEPQSLLDIGTGTGLLSLMLAQKTDTLIDGIEVDKDAFVQAKENMTASHWANRLNLFHADIREFIFPTAYDIIVSNPPFYENELKSPDEKRNIAHHGGLPLNDLLGIIKKNIPVNGRFYLLFPFKRNAEMEKLVANNELSILNKTLVRQSVNHDYFRIMIEGKHKEDGEISVTEEISIWDDQQQYTPAFTKLLKDYYLYL